MSKEIISKFGDNPKTKTARWAMGLGMGSFLVFPFLGIFAAVIRPLIDKTSSENTGAAIGFGIGIIAITIILSALSAGIIAFRKGERSWALWAGFIPAIFVVCILVLMIIGEFIFPH